MELLYYPQTFQLLIDQNLLQTVHHFLSSNKHKIIVSANHFFSSIYTDKKFIDIVGPNTNFSVIIDNAGYEVDLDVQISSLWLLIDIASCGPVFIQQLINFIMNHTGMSKYSFGGYWKDKEINPFLIMQWVDIVIYRQEFNCVWEFKCV